MAALKFKDERTAQDYFKEHPSGIVQYEQPIGPSNKPKIRNEAQEREIQNRLIREDRDRKNAESKKQAKLELARDREREMREKLRERKTPVSQKIRQTVQGIQDAPLFGKLKSGAIAWGNRINDTHEYGEGSRGTRRRREPREAPQNTNPFGIGNSSRTPSGMGMNVPPGFFDFNMGGTPAQPPRKRKPAQPPLKRKGRKSQRTSARTEIYDPMHIPKSLRRFF
jgi:hypothetical protein